MKIAPEELLGLSGEGFRAGFYNEVWRQAIVDLDMALYRLRVMALASWREKPSPDWRVLPSAPVRRYEAPNAEIEGKLYVFGGFSGTEIQALTRTDVYDPETDSWSSGPPLPEPVTHVVPETADGQIWVVGGFYGDHPGPSTDLVYSYDLASGEWRKRKPLPQPTASAVPLLAGRTLHLVGGFLDRDATTAAHWALSLDEPEAWVERAPMKHARGHHTAAVVDGKLYVFGGQFRHDTDPVDLDVAEVYDPAADCWSDCAPLPQPRSHAETSTVVRDGRIVLIGGLNRNAGLRIRGLPDVTSYDPQTDLWTALAPLPVGLIGPGAKVIGDRLYVTGGADLLRPGAAQTGTLSCPASVLDPG